MLLLDQARLSDTQRGYAAYMLGLFLYLFASFGFSVCRVRGHMRITKVINNNVVLASEGVGSDVILTGRGIGFQKHAGDLVYVKGDVRIYRASDPEANQFRELADEISPLYRNIASDIIEDAEETLGTKLSRSVYLTLTDHISASIERAKNNQLFTNNLLWEIKRFYPREFAVAKRGMKEIEEKTGVSLPDDEAGFVAMHLINSEVEGSDVKNAASWPEMIRDIVNIIRYSMKIEIDEDSIAYERLVTHIKFFLQRAIGGVMNVHDDMMDAFPDFCKSHPEEYQTAERIASYMKAKIGRDVPEDEKFYLTIHITRLCREQKNKK